MEQEQTVTLKFLRTDGLRRESTTLTHHTLADARQLAKWVFEMGAGLYTEVDIYTEDGHVERLLQNTPAAAGI